MDFVKMEGLGNDFVVIAGPLDPSAADVAAWCNRRLGIGADGVLVVSPRDGGSVRMEYWNADGSPAEMCGNGLRCTARFAHDEGMVAAPEFTVVTPVGERAVVVRPDGSVRADLGVVALSSDPPFEVAGYSLQSVSVGNPHAVAIVDDCYSVPVGALGPIVEGDPHYPERTNVEFATVVGRDRIDVRVWERGVGESIACGTGAAAAAAVAYRGGLVEGDLTVMLPGGPLYVEVGGDRVWIDGPTRRVFSGRI
jgi:diaminopimelate epimerase